MIKGIKFATIPVSDQDRALAFYTDKLGFRIQTDQPFNAKQRWIELSIPGAETGVVLFTPEGHENRIGGFSGISFHCQDLRKTYDELVARGVEFAGPPKKEPWGSFVIVKDPDGNQFVLSGRS
jgi:predicted enzyme related to lactoylglutathione lyase